MELLYSEIKNPTVEQICEHREVQFENVKFEIPTRLVSKAGS